MKKIIILVLSLFFSVLSVNAYDIIYTNISDGSKLYKKSANDSSNGVVINSAVSIFPAVSPNGQYIIYSNGNDGQKLYKKPSNDSSSGVAITSVISQFPNFSPDGLYVIYINNSDGRIYKKSINDSSNGASITSVNSSYPVYSPDGQYIIYSNGDDGYKLYKKSANDSSNGVAITSVASYSKTYSPDGQYIIYSNGSDGQKLYKKSANDSSDGVAITSVISTSPVYSPDGQYIIYSNGNDGGKLYKKSANDSSDGVAITSVASDYPAILPDTGVNQTQTQINNIFTNKFVINKTKDYNWTCNFIDVGSNYFTGFYLDFSFNGGNLIINDVFQNGCFLNSKDTNILKSYYKNFCKNGDPYLWYDWVNYNQPNNLDLKNTKQPYQALVCASINGQDLYIYKVSNITTFGNFNYYLVNKNLSTDDTNDYFINGSGAIYGVSSYDYYYSGFNKFTNFVAIITNFSNSGSLFFNPSNNSYIGLHFESFKDYIEQYEGNQNSSFIMNIPKLKVSDGVCVPFSSGGVFNYKNTNGVIKLEAEKNIFGDRWNFGIFGVNFGGFVYDVLNFLMNSIIYASTSIVNYFNENIFVYFSDFGAIEENKKYCFWNTEYKAERIMTGYYDHLLKQRVDINYPYDPIGIFVLILLILLFFKDLFLKR